MKNTAQKGIAHIFLLLVILVGIGVGIFLVQNPQILKSRAGGGAILLLDGKGVSLPVNKDNLQYTTSPNIQIEFYTTLGAPVAPTGPVSSPVNTGFLGRIFNGGAGTSGPISTSPTVSFRYAEDPVRLESSPFQPYTKLPMKVSYSLISETLGDKFMYVEFRDSTGKVDRQSKKFLLTSSTSSSLNNGLMAYWRMEDPSNSYTWADSTYPTSGTSKVFNNTGKQGAAHDFYNGAFTGLKADMPSTEYTYSAWFKTSNATGTMMAAVRPITPNTGAHDRELALEGGRVCHRIWADQKICSSKATFNDNQWHLATVTVGSGGTKLFVDGAQVGTGMKTSSDFDSDEGLVIGSGSQFGHFNGTLDEVVVWKRQLSTSEVTSLYNNGNGVILNPGGDTPAPTTVVVTPTPTSIPVVNTLKDGLYGYWNMNETTGTTLADLLGKANAISNGTNSSSGKVGTARNYNGTSHLAITTSLPTSNYTYAVWFKSGAPTGTILSAVAPVVPTAGAHDRQIALWENGKVCNRVWADERICSPKTYNDNQWHLVVSQVGTGGTKLFVDGVQVAVGKKTQSDFSWAQGMVVGRGSQFGSFNGQIDELGIWSRLLTTTEIQSLYNNGQGQVISLDTSKKVFVTSSVYNGNLNGVVGADAKCQIHANSAGLTGTYKAWLSSGSLSAESRLSKSTAPYKLVNGTVIANNWTDLTDQVLSSSIKVNEFGIPVTAPANYWDVWTNTSTSGGIYDVQSNLNCSSWTSSASTQTGRGGTSAESGYRWTSSEFVGHACNTAARLYCFEQ